MSEVVLLLFCWLSNAEQPFTRRPQSCLRAFVRSLVIGQLFWNACIVDHVGTHTNAMTIEHDQPESCCYSRFLNWFMFQRIVNQSWLSLNSIETQRDKLWTRSVPFISLAKSRFPTELNALKWWRVEKIYLTLMASHRPFSQLNNLFNLIFHQLRTWFMRTASPLHCHSI